MLKIKNNVDLKELEKFGFTKREDGYWVKKVYLGNADDDKNFYQISEETRKIELTRLDGELDDTLYDLIQAGLVEKVGEGIMEEEILDIKRENYKLRKENFELIQDNTKLQQELDILNYKLREKICMEAHSQFKELQENSISKSKVKELIEELEEIRDKFTFGKPNYKKELEYAIGVLIELLGE